MIEGVGEGQVLEDIIVGGQRRGGEDRAEDRVGGVVERVGGDQRTAMDISGKDKLNLGRPLLDGFRFLLRPLVVLLEVVWEVSVQVEPASIVSEK